MGARKFLLPKLGESITEATLISWTVSVGDVVELDETIAEIATDKVDSELPSPYAGKVLQLLYQEGGLIQVGAPIAIIESDQEEILSSDSEKETCSTEQSLEDATKATPIPEQHHNKYLLTNSVSDQKSYSKKALRPSESHRFYSPLIRSIAELELITVKELDLIPGSGKDGRVTKKDLMQFIRWKNQKSDVSAINYDPPYEKSKSIDHFTSGEVEIVEMDRTRQLIAEHMVRSKRTSPHVTSFLEVDVSELVQWREQVKSVFGDKYDQKITFTPIIIDVVAKAIKEFSGINASVDGNNIVLKKDINIGMATLTNDGNLIVPVLKGLGDRSLKEIIFKVNDLSGRARVGKLKPDEIRGGTFTVTNVGTFGNTMGTPIINQPQVAILSIGAIRRVPAVINTSQGEEIGIRSKMFLSLSYDHRIVDGALGGRFLRKVGDLLEQFDDTQTI